MTCLGLTIHVPLRNITDTTAHCLSMCQEYLPYKPDDFSCSFTKRGLCMPGYENADHILDSPTLSASAGVKP